MKPFRSEWLTWGERRSDTPHPSTAKTDKTPIQGADSKLLLFPPTPDYLKYPLDFVRREVPELSSSYRERYEYWLDLMTGAGWSQEDAERAAFRKVNTGPPDMKREK